METVLLKIQEFADQAHGEQLRKYSTDRYIVHPVRVMLTCRIYNASLCMQAAALLHDVLEDTAVDSAQLLQFLQGTLSPDDAQHTLLLVEELTDVYVKSAYPKLNRSKRKTLELERLRAVSAEAQTIKYADIIDNCSEIVSSDPGFALHYLVECQNILECADRGNEELRQVALETVSRELAHLTHK